MEGSPVYSLPISRVRNLGLLYSVLYTVYLLPVKATRNYIHIGEIRGPFWHPLYFNHNRSSMSSDTFFRSVTFTTDIACIKKSGVHNIYWQTQTREYSRLAVGHFLVYVSEDGILGPAYWGWGCTPIPCYSIYPFFRVTPLLLSRPSKTSER